MSLIRWEPFREIASVRRVMDNLFDDSMMPRWYQIEKDDTLVPPVDMLETDKEIIVKAVLPGVSKDGLNVDILGDTLTIRGETKSEKEEKKEHYIYRESHHGTFTRSITLPEGLEMGKGKAEIENGVLTIKIPKAENLKPKSIKIEVKKEEQSLKEAEKTDK